MLYLDLTQAAATPKQTGVERFQRGLYRALASRHDVRPLVWDPVLRSYCTPSKRDEHLLKNPFSTDSSGVKKPEGSGMDFLLRRYSSALLHLGKKVSSFSGAGDLFVATEHFTDGRLEELAKPCWKETKRAAICYDTIPLIHPEEGRRKPFEKYIETLSSFDLVFCISGQTAHCLRDALTERKLPCPKLIVIELPIDFPEGRPPFSFAEPKEVLFVSSLNARKNHKNLIAACEQLWDDGMEFRLVLVGRTGKGEEEIERLVLEKEKVRPIRWLRYINEDQLREQYRRCTFTAFPSLQEGFGLPVIESLWYGKPCVCSDRGAVGEVAQNGGCLQIDVSNVDALSNGIRTLLASSEKYRQLKDEALGRKFATWDDFIQNWLVALEPLVKHS